MATDSQQSKRRKIEPTSTKLFTVHQKVEVRRLEDGFLGSWHTATVICCEDLSRLVQFDHILADDGSTHLIESVKVTPLIDGLFAGKVGMSSNHQSVIRPLPPSCILEPQQLHYGQLVDCFYGDAWWEGVIFDDKDGDENRNVFFPDMGDEVHTRIDMLRLSQDWDEVSEEWKPRGNWQFLEILEKLEHDFPLLVSIKQIWYELRVKRGFKELKDWNSSERSVWRNLVLEVLSDNFKIFFKHFGKELNLALHPSVLGQSLLEFSESMLDSILQCEGLLDNPPADIPLKATCHHQQIEQSDAVNLGPVVSLTMPTLPNNSVGVSQMDYSNSNDEVSSMGVRLSNEESMHIKRLEQRPVPDTVPAANYFPDAIVEANEMYKLQKKVTPQVLLNARKHLLELGWKIECVQHEKRGRLEYLSPDGKRFRSLGKICQELAMPSQPSGMSPNSRKKVPSTLNQKPQASNKLPKLCTPDVIVVEPEYCPESVSDYYNNSCARGACAHGTGKDLKLVAWRAKRHLSATGWSFVQNAKPGKVRYRYRSPTGKSFDTLRAACKWCLQLGTGSQNDCGPSQGEMANVSSQDACYPSLVVIEPKYCPESVNNYYNKCSSSAKNKYCKLDALNAKRHLSASGWSFDYTYKQGSWRMHYKSPSGRVFYSLLSACKWCIQAGTVSQDDCGHILGETGNGISLDNCRSTLGESGKASSVGDCSPGLVVIDPEYCPESVSDYYNKRSRGERGKHLKLDALKAKRHLSATGWSFDYIYKASTDNWKMRFRSPTGRVFHCLLSACKWCLKVSSVSQDDCGPTLRQTSNVGCIKDSAESISVNVTDLRQMAVDSGGKLSLVDDIFEKPVNQSKGLVRMMEAESNKNRIQRKSCKNHKLFPSGSSQRRKKRRKPHGLTEARKALKTVYTPARSNRRPGEVAESSSHASKNILSWLIDNNVLLPRSKVQCQGNKDSHPVQHGRITREGIKCRCCRKKFSLTSFQRHAGITNSVPAANIFLLDGRSLLDCQAQLNLKMSNGNSRPVTCEKTTDRQRNRTNDNVCAICRYGGELVLCDQCPSSFHTHCLGLKEVPSGDWFCRSCCCKICGQGKFDERNEPLEETSILICNQCERKFHVGCVKIEGLTQVESYPEGFWFCRDTCEQIYYGLRKSLGMPVSLGTGNLSWTLVKYIKPESHDHDTFATGYLIESHSKLHIALSLMHECFEPIEEPGCTTDLVEDVIFSRSSELNRLNFQGFYTVLLEKDDELISAATVRIYSNRVAEIPLVATSSQYRRLGMCRILMNELEKKLIDLGVERLVLPAVPSVLNTWTTSFGFSIMNESERLSLLEYTFLCFQGTVICQKLLTVVSPSASSLCTDEFEKNGHPFTENVKTELDGNSAVTEALCADQVEAIDDGTEDNSGNDYVQVNQPANLNYSCSTTLDSPIDITGHEQVADSSKAQSRMGQSFITN